MRLSLVSLCTALSVQGFILNRRLFESWLPIFDVLGNGLPSFPDVPSESNTNASYTPASTPTKTSPFFPVYTKVEKHASGSEEREAGTPSWLRKASDLPGYDIVKQHPGLLPNASVAALHFQPAVDFKVRSCYHAAAVSKDGTMHPGLRAKNSHVASDCRNPLSLTPQYNNVYVRRRCNHGWCAWMYDYYFPKDVMTAHSNIFAGHRHEWEHVIVWTNMKPDFFRNDLFINGTNALHWDEVSTQDQGSRDSMRHGLVPKLEHWVPEHVSFSYHREASKFDGNSILWHNGTHPKIIYTKQGLVTHIVRPAKGHDTTIWNHSGEWVFGSLVEWDGIATPEIRSEMCEKGAWGAASPSIGPDDEFVRKVERAIPDDVRNDGFNATYDVYDKIPQFAALQ